MISADRPSQLDASAPTEGGAAAAHRIGRLAANWATVARAGVALLVGLGLTALLWNADRQAVTRRADLQFDAVAERVFAHLSDGLARDQATLRAYALALGDAPAHDEAHAQRLLESVPVGAGESSIDAIAFAARVVDPESEAAPRTARFPVVAAKGAVRGTPLGDGADLASEPALVEAMARALEGGTVTLSAPLPLAGTRAGDGAQVAMVVPVFAAGAGARTPAERRAALRGFAASLHSIRKLADAAVDADRDLVSLAIADGATRLHAHAGPARPPGALSRTIRSRDVGVGGRVWTAEVAGQTAFDDVVGASRPDVVLAVGTLASFLFAALVAVASDALRRSLDVVRGHEASLRTALAKAEASEARARAVIDNAQDGIITIDERGIVQTYNAGAARIFGHDEHEVVGRNVSMLMNVADGATHDRHLEQFSRTGEARIIGVGREVAGRHRDGRVIPLELSVTEMRVEGRRLYCGILRDITERKAAEEAIRDSERKLQSYIDLSLDGVLVVDERGRYLEANPAARGLLGYDADELLKLSIGETLYPDEDNLRAGEAHFRRVVETGRSVGEVALRRKDGTPVIADINAVALGGGRYLGLLRDVTARHHGERLLQRERQLLETRVAERTAILTQTNLALEQEIAERTRVERQLRAARELAVQAAETKAGFLANMSHELRTPMNAVIGTAALLQDTPLSAEQRNYVDMICASGDVMLALINDILDFSKIESGMLKLEVRPIEVGHVVEQAFDMLAGRASEKGLELGYAIGEDAPAWVLGDATRLRQVLVNLLSNAVKFTERGEIWLSVGTIPQPDGPPMLQFSVRDTGIGMPADRTQWLFKPFSQADLSTTRKYGGTGLGLAICARLVRMMGGEIRAESEEGRGSTFHVVLPATPAESAGRPHYPNAAVPALAGKRALILTDSAVGIHMLEGLCRRWGLDTVSAGSVADAARTIGSGVPLDVAIVDEDLAGPEPAEVVPRLKAAAGERVLPIVVLADSPQDGGAAPGGADAAARVPKPVKHSVLFRVLLGTLGVDDAPSRVPDGATAPAATLAQRVPLKILVAEDSKMNQKVIGLILAKLGYGCDIAETGVQVLEKLAVRHYDVVFMDLQMPEMDGLEATRRILEEWPSSQRPYVVAMTAVALPGDRERCLAAGMNDYIAKPVLPASVQSVIERLAARGGPAASANGGAPIDARTIAELRALEDPGAPSLVRALVSDYLDEAPRHLEEIRQRAAAQDATALAARAHKLAGMSLSLGATDVARACSRIEKAASRGENAAFADLVDELVGSFASAQDALARLIET